MQNLFKNPRFWTGVIVAIILVTIITQSKKPAEEQKAEEKNSNSQNTEQQEPPKTIISNPNAWEGQLKLSDNSAKGNLMLITTDKTIYIKTSRDFSALINKKVSVTYEGTLETFRLGDIVESQ